MRMSSASRKPSWRRSSECEQNGPAPESDRSEPNRWPKGSFKTYQNCRVRTVIALTWDARLARTPALRPGDRVATFLSGKGRRCHAGEQARPSDFGAAAAT